MKSNVREFFPFYQNKNQAAYLDSGATSQKPYSVIERMDQFYRHENANIHRGVYKLSETATANFENVRPLCAKFLGGVSPEEIIFTSGTTDGINLLAYTLTSRIKPGDEILLTTMEHHANFVPWQMLAQRTQAVLRFVPFRSDLRIHCEDVAKLLTPKTRIFAFTHASNVLGSIQPAAELCKLARANGTLTLVDGAQAVPHFRVNLPEIDPDFYVFSGHKMLGPTGGGVLFAKARHIHDLPPFRGGGDMITKVGFDGFECQKGPQKFEAGTPNIAGVLGLGAAMEFLMGLDLDWHMQNELRLSKIILDELSKSPAVRILSSQDEHNRLGIVTFHHQGIHPHDMAFVMDSMSVCIRAGHHCAQPLMKTLGVDASSRASFYIYNDETDCELFLKAFHKAERVLLV